MMSAGQKAGLFLVFALVLVTIVLDILRTLFTVSEQRFKSWDQYILWCLLEPTIAVMICALPCYRGLVARGGFVPSFLSSVQIPSATSREDHGLRRILPAKTLWFWILN